MWLVVLIFQNESNRKASYLTNMLPYCILLTKFSKVLKHYLLTVRTRNKLVYLYPSNVTFTPPNVTFTPQTLFLSFFLVFFIHVLQKKILLIFRTNNGIQNIGLRQKKKTKKKQNTETKQQNKINKQTQRKKNPNKTIQPNQTKNNSYEQRKKHPKTKQKTTTKQQKPAPAHSLAQSDVEKPW